MDTAPKKNELTKFEHFMATHAKTILTLIVVVMIFFTFFFVLNLFNLKNDTIKESTPANMMTTIIHLNFLPESGEVQLWRADKTKAVVEYDIHFSDGKNQETHEVSFTFEDGGKNYRLSQKKNELAECVPSQQGQMTSCLGRLIPVAEVIGSFNLGFDVEPLPTEK